jgi:uncharacterized protein (TIGR00369 family)
MDPDFIRRLAEKMIPFNRFLGVRLVTVERARVEMEIPWRDELIGDPLRPAVHGGVISTLIDTTGGIAIWNALDRPEEQRVSTIDLRVDYLRPGRSETLVCEATVVRAGRSVGVTDMRVFHPSAPGDTIATGKGVYAIKTRGSKP